MKSKKEIAASVTTILEAAGTLPEAVPSAQMSGHGRDATLERLLEGVDSGKKDPEKDPTKKPAQKSVKAEKNIRGSGKANLLEYSGEPEPVDIVIFKGAGKRIAAVTAGHDLEDYVRLDHVPGVGSTFEMPGTKTKVVVKRVFDSIEFPKELLSKILTEEEQKEVGFMSKYRSPKVPVTERFGKGRGRGKVPSTSKKRAPYSKERNGYKPEADYDKSRMRSHKTGSYGSIEDPDERLVREAIDEIAEEKTGTMNPIGTPGQHQTKSNVSDKDTRKKANDPAIGTWKRPSVGKSDVERTGGESGAKGYDQSGSFTGSSTEQGQKKITSK